MPVQSPAGWKTVFRMTCFRSWVMEADKGSYPNVTRVKLPRLCNQCQDAPLCVAVCPVKATYRDVEGGGVIKVDSAKCIGRYCMPVARIMRDIFTLPKESPTNVICVWTGSRSGYLPVSALVFLMPGFSVI